jgi:ATP-dependent DNA helicase RecG
MPETLPPAIVARHGFPALKECLEALHRPSRLDGLERFRERLRYEELYAVAITLRLNRRQFALPGRAMRAGELGERFVAGLPFAFTEGQRQAVEVLHADAASERRMHRLLQGDVGCGKTVVAFAACLPALASGLQVAWLAPTEVLARQTFDTVRAWLKPLGFGAELLTAATATAGKRAIREGLKSGDVRFVVGTHALLQDTVAFGRLGMAVIDEQQRFGVAQRAGLLAKGPEADFLLMTATPIPQTLAQAIYGDLEVVTIRGLPPGRIPVETHLVPEAKRRDMERFIAGRAAEAQAYYVVPRIEAGEDEEGELRDLTSAYEDLSSGPFRGIPSAVVHGRMAAAEKDEAVRSFAEGRARVLVATSVVEVGLDAPGATIMVIENAECFGLSQLHQLRGRVGRAGQKAYCFVLSPAVERDPTVRGRLEEFSRMHDGFAIADLDLKLRGPGQAAGLRQSGWDDPSMAAIMEDIGLFRTVQEEIESLIAV